MFGSDMYVAAFIAVLVVMGLMKGAVLHVVTHTLLDCIHYTVRVISERHNRRPAAVADPV